MKRTRLPDDVVQALAAADRSAGWNNRSRIVRRFDLDGCTLFVVPFRCWANRRQEQQAAAWHAERGHELQA